MTLEEEMIQSLHASEELPNTVAIFGVCRSGTTAMLVAFAKAGYLTYYQPFKHSLRYRIVGEVIPQWMLPNGSPFVFKETIGPYYEDEIFNPAQIIRTLWPTNHTIIWMIRDPFHTWKSWEKKFSGTSFSLFQKAYKKQLDILYFLQKNKMSFTIIDFSHSYNREQSIFDVITSNANIPMSSEFYDWRNSEDTIPVSQPVKEPQPFLESFQGDDSSGNPVSSISQRESFLFPKNEQSKNNSTEWDELYKIYTDIQKHAI